jgi:hypothetical protein
MACLVKVGNEFENLSGFNTFIRDISLNSKYFKIQRFPEQFTSGKNLFLMEGSKYLKESTAIKIEIVDVEGNTVYVEPGRGIPDYYEGNSVVLSAHVYDNMPVGPAKITILGELKEYEDANGIVQPIPESWNNTYNVKWEREFFINKNLGNVSPVIFYKKPSVEIQEIEALVIAEDTPTITKTGLVVGTAEVPELGTDLTTWRAGTLYRLELVGGDSFTSAMDESTITIPSLNYTAKIKEVINSTTILTDTALSQNGKVVNFPSAGYTSSFQDFSSRVTTESSVTASYGRITVNNLDTFTGNVDKLKIYKKSRSDVGGFKFVDEVKIVGGEILRDETMPGSDLDGGFGRLTENNVERYWSTSSIDLGGIGGSSITYDNDLLYESIRINISQSAYTTESVSISTNTEFDVYDNIDYELNFKTLISGSWFDVIEGYAEITSESYSRTYYYKYDPTKLTLNDSTFISTSSYTDLDTPNSQSVDFTKPLIYDNSRVTFFNTPQNLTGSVYTSVPIGYIFSASHQNTLTFDTTSGDWGTESFVQTQPTDKANIVTTSGSFDGGEFILTVWLDSGSDELPINGLPKDVEIYFESYVSSSVNNVAVISLKHIDTDAKFYYKNSTTKLDTLESFQTSIEYPLEPIDNTDYQLNPLWHSTQTGSQAIIPFEDNGFNYIHIDYRTLREVEPINTELISVQRLDSINGDILYGSIYEILNMNFNTGDIEFNGGEQGTMSGVVTMVDGRVVITVGSDTEAYYLAELDFEQSIIIFTGKLDITEVQPVIRSYDLYDLFDLTGSNWLTTSSTELFVPRVPPQAGDYLYTNQGYPYRSTEFSDRNFLTTEFTSPSSSLGEFPNPLEIPYIFRNDNDIIENVYVEDSDQVYVVSSLSSSVDINNTDYIYTQSVQYSGFFSTGSASGSIYVDATQDVDNYQVSLPNYISNITAHSSISHLSGSINIALLTDKDSTELPTLTSSLEFHLETFSSGSDFRTALALRNVETDAKLFISNSPTSQSLLESYSGSVNYILTEADSTDFTHPPIWTLSPNSSQVIFSIEEGENTFIYIDYRTNRNDVVLNADLNELTAISGIGSTDFSTLLAREVFPYSGSKLVVGDVTSSNYLVPRLPIVAGDYFFTSSGYPFVTASIVDGMYITDDADPSTDLTIPDGTNGLQIPYSFDMVDGVVHDVYVQRFDAIYTASSIGGTETTKFEGPLEYRYITLKDPDTIYPKTLTAFLTGSYFSSSVEVPFKEVITEVKANSEFKFRQDIQQVFTNPYSGSAKLGFDVDGDGWQISKISFKPSQAPAFSPKIYKTLDEQERNLPIETFDYRFELYDVNNNYIPVELNGSKTFSGGNKVTTDLLKLLTFESDRTSFRFYSGSLANPSFQQVKFNFSKTSAITGSITFESSAYDKDGNYIEPSSYVGTYPGALTSQTPTSAILTVANFSGSDLSYNVGNIVYTASAEGIESYETIFRLEDGQTTADLLADVDRNTFTYKLSNGVLSPDNQKAIVSVKRKNLETNAEPILINSSSVFGTAPNLTLISDNPNTGLATYFLSGSDLDLQSGSITYEFTSSDQFNVEVTDSITITPISFLEGVVVYLSNERGILPAYYNGDIPSASYEYTSGSTKLYVGSEEVTYDTNGGSNTYKIIGVTGSGIIPNEVNPNTNNYGGVPGTMTTDSSSLEINIQFTDITNRTYDFSRTANFNIIREGEPGQPGLEGSNGPGVVFTGNWDIARDYTVTSGSLPRKDAVLFDVDGDTIPETYFLAITGSGPDSLYGSVPPSGSISSSLFWEELGTGSNFVAAKIAIFEESYIQNTLNIGTNNTGSVSAANLTLSGGTNYPYMSIGQSGDTGTQGYGVGNGIFLGRDGNDGEYKFSLEKELGDHLKWDGSKLDIQGSLMVGEEGSGIYLDGENKKIFLGSGNYASADTPFYVASGSAYFSLGDKLTFDGSDLTIEGAIQFTNTPDLITDTLLTSSLYVSGALESASLAQQSADNSFSSASAYSASLYLYASESSYQVDQDLQGVILGTTALENGSGGTFINAGIIYSPNIGGTNGYFSNAFRVGQNGITLDGSNSRIYVGDGLYDDTNTPFYFASGSTNIFSLGDKLTWDGDNLTIEGSITLTNNLLDGYAQSSEVSSSIQNELDGALDGYAQSSDVSSSIQNELEGALDGYVSNSQTSSLINPETYSFGPSATYQLTTPTVSTEGLYLGNQYLGYYNGGWKTFMGNDGSFYLGGDAGALQWDGGSNLVISGSIYAENGTFSGNVDGGTINIGSGNFTVNSSGNVFMAGSNTIDGNLNMSTNSSITSGFLGGWNLNPNGLSLGAEIFDYNNLFTVQNASLEFNGIGRSSEILYFERIGYPSPATNNYSYLDIKSDGAIRLRPDVNSNYTFDDHVTAYGDFRATGNITAYYSDDRLKTRLDNIVNPLDKIKTLNGFQFKLNEEGKSLGFSDDSIQIGVSAQEVQKVLPEVVKPAPIDDKYLTVQYERIVPLLIEGIKELTERVEHLEEENKKLKG